MFQNLSTPADFYKNIIKSDIRYIIKTGKLINFLINILYDYWVSLNHNQLRSPSKSKLNKNYSFKISILISIKKTLKLRKIKWLLTTAAVK